MALKSFKNEISTLKTKIHHVSLERDKLKSSLNRTMEEKQKLIAEGDEHVEMVTKKSERKIKYVSLIEKGGGGRRRLEQNSYRLMNILALNIIGL